MGVFAEAAFAISPPLIMEMAGLSPDRWQADVLRQRPSRLLLNCARQAGKTQVVAAAALDKAIAADGSLVLLLSPSERQSKELFRRVMQINGAIGLGVKPESESTTGVIFANGSRIVALPGKEQTIRGFSSVSLIIIDEAARVPDDLYRAVRPMLA